MFELNVSHILLICLFNVQYVPGKSIPPLEELNDSTTSYLKQQQSLIAWAENLLASALLSKMVPGIQLTQPSRDMQKYIKIFNHSLFVRRAANLDFNKWNFNICGKARL